LSGDQALGDAESIKVCSLRGMDLRVSIEPQQGASYDDLLRVAKAADDLGFDGFFRSDHYLTFDANGLPGPTDAWVTLGALARETGRVRLGTLLSPVTFRLPGPLAIQVAQVDAMSGGRVELGIGAGWFEAEQVAYGIPFPEPRERFDRLIEQVAIIDGYGAPCRRDYSFHMPKLPMTDFACLFAGATALVRQSGRAWQAPQIELEARFADEFNVGWQDVAETATILARARAVIDREIVYSAAQVLCVGRNDTEFARRAAAIRQRPDDLNTYGEAGTPAQVVDRIGRFAQHGITRFYLQTLDLNDLDHLELVATQVAPQL
jgi:alkanesulfonate monooxygenase SsuD/methylene tetrahydromethanopterin reductase-like flavin-dependent oxidoreductase (luciferase family)